MDAIRADLCTRACELRAYLRHVRRVSESAQSESEKAIAKSLRAAAYLLTYNMVEATARNVVSAVFDRLTDESISFDQLTVQLKVVLLTHAKRRKPDKLALSFTAIASDIVAQVFDPGELFAGNVDARKLKSTARQIGYGVNSKTGRAAPALLTVKNMRNDLAHGNKTFSEIGRDTTIDDLRSYTGHAILYMCEVMRNVEKYIQARAYLAAG